MVAVALLNSEIWPTVVLIFVTIFLHTSQASKWENFEVIWNFHSGPCKINFNVSVPVESYGILANKEQKFYGDEIVLFYEQKFGLYPRVAKNGTVHNGGIPQAADLAAHLTRVAQDIRTAIPNSGFTGNAVIDWESWWPKWGLNWGRKRVYKKMSYKLAKKYMPKGTKRQRRKLARQQFEKAAKRFMLSTLSLGRQLRPYAKWGFYGYPLCLRKEEEENYCSSRKVNDKWKWLFDDSTGLYPSIYLRTPDLKKEQPIRHEIIQAQILETQRFVTKWRKIPIFPFTRIMYDPYHRKTKNFYSKADLCSSVKQAADLGVNGVVVWGSWFSVSTKENCQGVADYIQDLFGPYSMLVKEQADRCAKKRCNNKGSCVLYPRDYCMTVTKYQDYHCRCRAPFQGNSCQKSLYWEYYKWRI